MSDLISRQDVLDVLRNLAFDHIFQCGEYYGEDERQLTIINAKKAIDVIKAMPSAESERKKGKWIDGMLYHDFDESEWEKVKCSVCKNFVTKQIFYHDNKYHYCPYCGADMRGE